MDDLSKMLNDSGIGCYVDNVCVNHVFYADDLCLMAPCAIALQQLLNICHKYSIMPPNPLSRHATRPNPKKVVPPSLANSAYAPGVHNISKTVDVVNSSPEGVAV